MTIKFITKSGIARFIQKLSQEPSSQKVKQDKVKTAVEFLSWLKKTNRLSETEFILYSSPLRAYLLRLASNSVQKRPILPNSSTSALKYVGFALGVISLTLLASGLYMRFFADPRSPLAYSSTPVQAGRTISFQGRLTDTLGNPINAPINMTYNFYTQPTGGSPISGSTRVCTANPDQDGIFANLIGDDTGPSCNTELPNALFTENSTVYLGVTVGSEPTEMSPRQQIANVGYAINAETLQGMPPGQGASTVPYINKDGNLLIATSNPGIRSTYASSNFTISSAQAVTIQSAGSGDITLSASEGGALRFNTYNGTLLERLTVLNNGNVGIGNTNPSERLDVSGNATVSGNIQAGGQLQIGRFAYEPQAAGIGSIYFNTADNTPYYFNGSAWTAFSSGTTGSYWGQGNGALFTANPTVDVLIGSLASNSAKFAFLNVNSGTPTASVAGALANVATYLTGDGTLGTTSRRSLTLGNSSLSNTTGNILLNPNGTGSVGIGTTQPNSRLEVVNGSGITSRSTGTSGQIQLLRSQTSASDTLGLFYTETSTGSIPIDIWQWRAGGSTARDLVFSNYDNTPLLFLGLSSATGNVGIGDASPDHKLDVAGNIGLDISGYINWGDVSGTTGYGFRDNGGVLEFKNSAGTWTPVGGSATNYWTLSNGALFPVNSTLDAFIGGTASNSAKFAFLNVNSGTPTASVAGALANVATYLTGDSTLGTTNRQSLTLGNSSTYNTTGDLFIHPNGTGNVAIGTTSINSSYKLNVSGDIIANALYDTTSPGNYYVNPAGVSTFGTGLIVEGYIGVNTTSPDRKLEVLDTANPQLRLSYADNTTYADFQMTSAGDLVTNVDGTTNQLVLDNAGTVGIGTSAPRNNLEVGNTSSNQSVRIGGIYRGPGAGYTGLEQETTRHQLVFSSWRDVQTDTVGAKIAAINKTAGSGPSWDLIQHTDLAFYTLGSTPTSSDDSAERMRITSSGNVGIGVTAPSAFLDLAPSTTAKASLNLSSSAGTNPSAPVSGDLWWNGTSLNFYTGSSTVDIIAGAGLWTDAGTYIYPTAGETLGNSTSGGANKIAGLYLATSAPLSFGLNNDVSFSFASSTLTTVLGTNAWNIGNNLLHLKASTNQIGIGTNNPLATFDVRALSGTTPVASFSGSTSLATMIVDQSGVGDIFTASRSGQTQFVITKDGYVGIGVANPTSRLSVAGSTSTLSNSSGDIIIDAASNFINFSGDALTNVGNIASLGQIQVGGFASAPTAIGNGAMYYNTTSNRIFYWDGSLWSEMGSMFWQRTLGSLAPQYITDALNIGAISTGSAIVHLPGTTNANAFFNLGTGSLGINTTSPNASYKLHVNGDILANAFYDTTSPGSWFINPAAGGTSVQIAGDIKMDGKINLTGASVAPMIDSDDGTSTWSTITIKGSNDTTSASLCIEGTGTGANCDGKLNVGTVDPPYTINGKKYATYFASMTGVKEETTGQVTVTQKHPQLNAFARTIYLDDEPDGSDLWLFNKTATLKKNYKDLTVLTTASTNTRTWYSYDPRDNSITFFAAAPTNVSYRLTAPRFDSEKWENTRPESDFVIGFVLNDTGRLSPVAKSFTENTIYNSSDTEYRGNLTEFKQRNALFTLTGDFVDQFMSASRGIFGQIMTGYIQTQNMLVESTLVATKTFTTTLTAGTAQFQRISSPVAEIETVTSNTTNSNTLQTNTIQPKDNSQVKVRLTNQPGSLSKLVIEGLNNAPVVEFDNAGNATFAGTLVAESLEATNASIAGTLIADTIQSQTINSLESNIASVSSTLAQSEQKITSDINSIQQQLALLAESQYDLPNAQYYQNLDASYSNLTVTETANIFKARISDSLLTGSVLIEASKILALSNDLLISSLGTIRLFDNAVIIAKDGTMTVNGELSAQTLAIKNNVGEIVASIDSSGSARFNEVIARKLSIDNIATQAALIGDSGQRDAYNNPIPGIVTNAEAAGNATLLRDTQELIIYNDSVTMQSLIYLTPTTNSILKPLTVSHKHSCDVINPECRPYFTVRTEELLHPDYSFNWLIIN